MSAHAEKNILYTQALILDALGLKAGYMKRSARRERRGQRWSKQMLTAEVYVNGMQINCYARKTTA